MTGMPEIPDLAGGIAKLGEGLLDNPMAELLSPPVMAAGAAGYLLGTAIDDATGHAISGGIEKGMEAVFGDPAHGDLTPAATPEGQTETPNGVHGHWVHDSNTPDIDATFIPDE